MIFKWVSSLVYTDPKFKIISSRVLQLFRIHEPWRLVEWTACAFSATTIAIPAKEDCLYRTHTERDHWVLSYGSNNFQQIRMVVCKYQKGMILNMGNLSCFMMLGFIQSYVQMC